jgi:hypothetical protein
MAKLCTGKSRRLQKTQEKGNMMSSAVCCWFFFFSYYYAHASTLWNLVSWKRLRELKKVIIRGFFSFKYYAKCWASDCSVSIAGLKSVLVNPITIIQSIKKTKSVVVSMSPLSSSLSVVEFVIVVVDVVICRFCRWSNL